VNRSVTSVSSCSATEKHDGNGWARCLDACNASNRGEFVGIITGEIAFGRLWQTCGRPEDVFLGIFAENVVFAKKREKTAHKFISVLEWGGYSEASGHCI
jgi:hypothetical protein